MDGKIISGNLDLRPLILSTKHEEIFIVIVKINLIQGIQGHVHSRVCPQLCVGPETCCTRFHKNQKQFNYNVIKVKVKVINVLSNLITREDNNSELTEKVDI